jgi:hypothetical protein
VVEEGILLWGEGNFLTVRVSLPLNNVDCLKHSFGLQLFCNSDTWNKCVITLLKLHMWYCMLLCNVFAYSHFIKNPLI